MNKKILLLLISFIYLNAEFIRDDTNNIIIDTKTGLVWSDTSNDIVAREWKTALDFCENLKISFYEDWRMPNYNELYSIIDLNASDTKIDTSFENKTSQRYWTSTTYALALGLNTPKAAVWSISFASGGDEYISINNTNSFYTRCVHDK